VDTNGIIILIIESKLFQGKAILVSGARQAGITTLLKPLLEELPGNILHLDGDDMTVQTLMNRPNTQQLKQITVGSEVSLQGLAQTVGADPNTVNAYSDILEIKAIMRRSLALLKRISENL
jgi:hypothetical protein